MGIPAQTRTVFPPGIRHFVRLALLIAGTGFLSGVGHAALSRVESTSPALAQFSIEVFEAEHGLPQNVVTAVLQTQDGYIWAGTFTGLARFDGVRFTVFDSSHTPGLSNTRVTSLFEDSRDGLWIGHETGDVSLFQDGEFRTMIRSEDWGGGSVVGIGEDLQGDVWFVDVLGRAVCARDQLIISSLHEAGSTWRSASLALNDSGQLCLATGEGLQIIDHGGRHVLYEGEDPRVENCEIIAAGRQGGIWILGDGMLRRFSMGAWVANLGAPPWGDEPVSALMESHDGKLFVGTPNQGLYVLAPGQTPVHLTSADGLPHVWVRALAEDFEGNVWAGTSGGLVVLRPRKVEVFNPPDLWQGRTVLSVTSGTNDTIWAGTEGAGVYQLRQGQWTRYGTEDGLTNLYVWSVLEDHHGALWAGSWGGGLEVLGEGGFKPPATSAQIPSVVAALARSRNGGLLVGTSAGLLWYADGSVEWLSDRTPLVLPDVRSIAETDDGSVWFGTPGGGLGYWSVGKVRVYRKKDGLPSDFILSLLLDAEETLWIGTLDSGLGFLRNGVFGHIGPEAGLPSALIGSIQDDGQNNLWVSSQNGLFRMNKTELLDYAAGRSSSVACLSYGKPEGMITVASTAGFQPSSCRTSDGRMWFPTAKGLAVIDPDHVRQNPVPPPVVIEKVLVDDQAQDLNAASSEVDGVGEVPLVVVPPGRQRFEFQYAGLSFTAPERVQFKLRFEGEEEDWSDVGTRRNANYRFLAPGRYVFRVIACNNDGVWNQVGAAVVLRLMPHFWQTVWFKSTLLGIVVLGIAIGVRFETRRRVRRKVERLERQQAMERERARIARDIHDDLGASLTRITMLSHTAQEDPSDASLAADYMTQIYTTARELTRSMDEIVWAVNPHHDSLDSLVNYLGRYAQQFLSATEIRCRLDVPVRLPAWPVRSEVRHNLYLALKEALNNTLKHASARKVRVSMELGADQFVLIISDDGCGFDPVQLKPVPGGFGGNGLKNMTVRLEQIGGRCELESRIGKGTIVRFFVKIDIPQGHTTG